jgi:hypothetical protein
MPAQDHVGRHDGGDLAQDPATKAAPFGSEVSALVIGQPGAAPLQLVLEDPVLLDHVLDDLLLVAIDPPREGEGQHLQRRESGVHWPILPGVGNG